MAVTKIHRRLNAKQVRPFSMDGATLDDLASLGVSFDTDGLAELQSIYGPHLGFSMDDAAGVAPVNMGSHGVPIQFLQALLPGTIKFVTSARKIDSLVGRTIAGQWHDEEVVQAVLELTGRARPYGDHSHAPLSSYTASYERRSIVRFEDGFEVQKLEEARAGAANLNANALKRTAVAESLAIEQNRVGFFGYSNGTNRTYGFLNDPNLPECTDVPAGASGQTTFASKTFKEITADFIRAASALRVASGDRVDLKTNSMTLAMPTSVIDVLALTTENGVSILDWLAKNYPNWQLKSAPELDGANGGLNVFYLYADTVAGPDEDGGQKVFDQLVPAALRLLGVERRPKGTREDYSNATAGCFLMMPTAVVRYSGI